MATCGKTTRQRLQAAGVRSTVSFQRSEADAGSATTRATTRRSPSRGSSGFRQRSSSWPGPGSGRRPLFPRRFPPRSSPCPQSASPVRLADLAERDGEQGQRAARERGCGLTPCPPGSRAGCRRGSAWRLEPQIAGLERHRARGLLGRPGLVRYGDEDGDAHDHGRVFHGCPFRALIIEKVRLLSMLTGRRPTFNRSGHRSRRVAAESGQGRNRFVPDSGARVGSYSRAACPGQDRSAQDGPLGSLPGDR